MPTDKPTPDPLETLLNLADRAAQQDAAQVGLGLNTRVMSHIREASAQGGSWQEIAWTRAFTRGAMASAALVVVLTAWAAVDAVYPTLMNDYALSALEEPHFWSLTHW